MSTLSITDTLPVAVMRSAGDFDAMWRDLSDATPDVWAIAHEPLPGLFSLWEPRIALLEQDDAYLLRAHLPGIQPDDITVECHQNLLTLRGEQSIESVSDQHEPYVKHGSRAFTRRFVLGEPVEADALALTYTPDGIEISIPKAVTAPSRPLALLAGAYPEAQR
jgi:HSP20 family protein